MNSFALYSGLFTVISNRIRDGLYITGMVLLVREAKFLIIIPGNYGMFRFSLTILSFGLIVKAAIFPFSNWLLKAIAAPTPISALVHSSTLVTAGLFLFIRFSDLFYPQVSLCK